MIVDAEPAARARLRLLCADLAALTVVGEAADGVEALALLERTPADLAFLDIEMPSLDGMALARSLCDRPHAPAVVFVTAFAQFAVAAWGVHAAGYLLKPVDPELLAPTVARVAALPRPAASAAQELTAFWAPHRSELVRVPVEAVEWIGGEGDYVRLHVGDRSYLLAERLYALEARLAASTFLRVHRSSLVRRNAVVGLKHVGSGAWVVTLVTGETLSIGRSYLSSIRSALGIAA